MKIIAITTNFGFGPSSKLYSIILELLKQEYKDITFCGNGESLKFLKNNFKDKLTYIDCDTDNIDVQKFSEVVNIENYDLLINVMNLDIPKLQKNMNLKIKSVFIDSLSWMWEDLLNGIDEYDIYFAQNKFIDQAKLLKYQNVQMINPIINTEGYRKNNNCNKNKILINFAGIMTPYENDLFYREYIQFYLKLFLEIPNINQYEIICACNTLQEMWIKENNNFDCNITFKVMTHKEFLSEACESGKIFSTPGLTFYLESMELGLRPHYLLPSNYSQALLLEKYSENPNNCIKISRYGYELSTDKLLDESRGVALVRQAFSEICENYSEKIFNDLTLYIDTDTNAKFKEDCPSKKESGEQAAIRIMHEKGLLNGG